MVVSCLPIKKDPPHCFYKYIPSSKLKDDGERSSGVCSIGIEAQMPLKGAEFHIRPDSFAFFKYTIECDDKTYPTFFRILELLFGLGNMKKLQYFAEFMTRRSDLPTNYFGFIFNLSIDERKTSHTLFSSRLLFEDPKDPISLY